MIGLDVGITSVHVVFFKKGRLAGAYTIASNAFTAEKLVKLARCHPDVTRRVALVDSAGKSGVLQSIAKGKLREAGFKLSRQVNELDAIPAGAGVLTREKNFILINIGTGTPFFKVQGSKSAYIKGTGMGNGFLEGFARLNRFKDASAMLSDAQKAKSHLDLTLGEALGRGLAGLPKKATASNFYHARPGASKQSMALSAVKLFTELMGSFGCSNAESAGFSTIVYTGGTLSSNPLLSRMVKQSVEMRGKIALIPENGAYCTAIGAVMCARKKK